MSCLFPCSHFHLIYSPTTKPLCSKIAFLCYFIEHSSFQACCFFFSTDLLFNATISFFLHVVPNIFWTCFKILSNLCFLLFLPLLPLIFFYHCIISCRFLLGKKADKMRCLSVPSCWFDILSPSQRSFITNISHLLPHPPVLLVASHFLTCLALFLSFLSLDNKNMINP